MTTPVVPPFNAALGNVNVGPGFAVSPRSTDVELLASSQGGHTQDGVTLFQNSQMLAVGTPLYRYDNGTYGAFAGEANDNISPTVTFTTGTNLVTTPSSENLAVNDRVQVATVSATNGVSANTTYYVVAVPSSTTFQISTTSGGTPVTISANSTGTNLIRIHDVDDQPNAIVGFLRHQTYTGNAASGDLPKFGLRVYKGILKYSVVKAANGGVDLTSQQLAAVNGRIDFNRDYLIIN